jgi:AbiV family abortive infection protein
MAFDDLKPLPDHANRHLLRYWERCRALFTDGDIPLAAFCAIMLIEEVGKVPMLAFRGAKGGLDYEVFRRHDRKYKSAVGTTLFVNSRVSRIYGEREKQFARWFREGDLMQIRNDALYMDINGDRIVTPEQVVSRDTAFLLVCFAGEVLAEIQGCLTGTGPDEWTHILAQVDEFREQFDTPS